MKCTACGNENQPGAKFCVHCGVVLSAAPAATASPPSSSTATAQRPAMPPAAATSSAAPPAATQTSTRPSAPYVPPAPSPSPPPAAAVPTPAPSLQPAGEPAVAGASQRNLGLTVGVVAAVIVIGVGGYFAYRMFAGEGAKQKMAAAEAPKTEAQSTSSASSVEAPKEAAPAAMQAQESSPRSGATPSAASVPASGTEAPKAASAETSSTSASAAPKSSDQSVMAKESAKEPGATRTTSARAAKATAAQPTSATAPGAAGSAGSAPPSAPVRTPSKAATTVAQALAAPQPDRWQLFADDLQKCRKEDFLSRFVCEQRTRARYCEGYWGKVPQCPSTPPTDHGQ